MDPGTVNRKVANRLRSERIERNWTQEELASALEGWIGYIPTKQTISLWERGGKQFDVGELWAFSKVFSRPIGWFMDQPTSTVMEH